MNKDKTILAIALTLGAYLRFHNLGGSPFWIDEVLYRWWVDGDQIKQEFIPIFLSRLLPSGEFWTRFPFALAGTLTIWAIYHVSKDKLLGASASLFVATFPLFVFWSRMARPYAFAGLFMVLGWRYSWCYLVSLFTTPVSLLGVNFLKKEWGLYFALFIVAGALYFIRQDVSNHEHSFFNVDFILSVRRIWYLPLLALTLYGVNYLGIGRRLSRSR